MCLYRLLISGSKPCSPSAATTIAEVRVLFRVSTITMNNVARYRGGTQSLESDGGRAKGACWDRGWECEVLNLTIGLRTNDKVEDHKEEN